jgi:hypothetical protein
MLRKLISQLAHKYREPTALRYLRLRVLRRTDNLRDNLDATENPPEQRFADEEVEISSDDARRAWWHLSCVVIKQKLIEKQRIRTALEVSMFIYMGTVKRLTTVGFFGLMCRTVDDVDYSNLDTAVKCNDPKEKWAEAVAFLLFLFTAGFPILIIWRGRHWRPGHTKDTSTRKSGMFSTMVRVSYIFNSDRQAWMAWLLARRALLVVCFQIGQRFGGRFPVPRFQVNINSTTDLGGFNLGGGKMDWRVSPIHFYVRLPFYLEQYIDVRTDFRTRHYRF